MLLLLLPERQRCLVLEALSILRQGHLTFVAGAAWPSDQGDFRVGFDEFSARTDFDTLLDGV